MYRLLPLAVAPVIFPILAGIFALALGTLPVIFAVMVVAGLVMKRCE